MHVGSQTRPKNCPKSDQKSIKKSIKFSIDFLLILAPFWYDFLTFLLVIFTCFSDRFFQASRTMFYQIFILGGISCFFGEPSLTRILLHENKGLRGYTFFKQHIFFAKRHLENYLISDQSRCHFRIVFTSSFMTCSAWMFASIC